MEYQNDRNQDDNDNWQENDTITSITIWLSIDFVNIYSYIH